MTTLDAVVEKLHERPLPVGWRWVTLADVAEINPPRPRGFQRDANAPTTFVPMPAVDAVNGTIAQPETRPYDEVATGYTFFQEGDVLFAKITPCMQNGKHVVARQLIDGVGFASTEFHVIRPGNELLADWVHSFVRQPSILNDATNYFTGAVGQQRVPDSFLKSLRIPLAPLLDQQTITTALREKMTAVKQARTAGQARLEAVRQLPLAILRDSFASKSASSWPSYLIGDIAVTCSGSTPSRAQRAYFGGTVPWVKTGELKDDIIHDTEEHLTDLAMSELGMTLLPKETLLIAMYGQGQTRGRTGVLGIPATTNQACFAILPNDSIDTQFVQLWFRHNYQRLREQTDSRGGNQPNLNGLLLRNIGIPVPPIHVQRSIARDAMKQLDSAQRAATLVQHECEAIDAIPAAVLRHVFRGVH